MGINQIEARVNNKTGSVSNIFQAIENGIHRLSRYFSMIGMASLMLMTLFIVIDVTGRYVFNSPLEGSIDLITIAMSLLVFSALAYCASQDGNVKVDVLYTRLSARAKAILDVFTSILSVVLVGILAWRVGYRAWSIINDPPGPTTPYFMWSEVPFMMLATIGFAILCLELIVWFIHSINNVKKCC